MQNLLIITNSYDVTTDLLLDRLEGQPVFRLNFDQMSHYRMRIDRDGFVLADPTGRDVSSQTVSKAYWRKPFNAPAEEAYARAKYVDAELRYALSELVSLLWLNERFVLVEQFAGKRTGKVIQLKCAHPFFEVPEYEFIVNHKSSRSAGVVKSLSNELVGDSVLYTTRVKTDSLAAKYPWFVESEVSAHKDVTVVYVRGKLFSYSLQRDFLERSVDWRRFASPEQKWEAHPLPAAMQAAVRGYMKLLRLDYGRLDFLLDADHRYWFCEVNPNGQFAWLDLNNEHGLLSCITEQVSPAAQTDSLSNKHPLAGADSALPFPRS